MRPLFAAAWGVVGGILGNVAIALAMPSPVSQIPVDDIPVPPMRVAESTGVGGPTTAPSVLAAGVTVVPGSKIVLLPFEALGDSANRQWVGRALQDSLTAEVARLGNLSPLEANVPTDGIDTAAAIAAGKANGGDVVVFGAYQFNDPEVRMTGQVVDVATGQAIAGMKVSGEFRDLFSLEDQLGTQLRNALHPPPPRTAQDKLADDQAIFGQQTPPLTTDDLYATPGYNPQFLDAYNRYFYDWSDFPFGYGGFGYGGYGNGYGLGGGYRFGGGFGHSHGGHHGHRVGYTPPPAQAAPPAEPVNQVIIGLTLPPEQLYAPRPLWPMSDLGAHNNGASNAPSAALAPAPAPQQQPAPPQPILAAPQPAPPAPMRLLEGH